MEPSAEVAAQNLSSSTEENYFLTYTFTDRSHSSRVAQSIMKLCMEDSLFADVTIVVEGKEFQLHRLVLSAQSCFFRSMFASNLKEGRNRVTQLEDVSASVFQLLVDYIYHGTVKLRLDDLQDTYEVADMYQLTALFAECSRFLVRTVQMNNCLQIMWLADQHSDDTLYNAAKHCAKIHLAELDGTEEFLNMPVRFLTDILADGVPCSQNPTNVIRNWIHYNREEREEFSETLHSALKLLYEDKDDSREESEEEFDDLQEVFEYYESESDFEATTEDESVEEVADVNATRNRPHSPDFNQLVQDLRKRTEEENPLHPQCFQNDPQWGPDEKRPRPTLDREGTLQNSTWCRCGHCRIRPSVEEKLCCQELHTRGKFAPDYLCITQHEAFSTRVLSRGHLITLLQFATKISAAEFQHNANRYLRLAAYRKFTNMLYGFLGKAHRVSVPSCVVKKIIETYCDHNGSHTGST
ncbi:kelch repeat and BTB domain-containing protein 4 isoform X2 [Eleutherodactylus coqui]|uniref:kelch repeat and BTB domain-containing protein 4 isoform X2 n=1 Tax=Eleutherodactylus coqui TaxID=57060 RepID=UPI003461D865